MPEKKVQKQHLDYKKSSHLKLWDLNHLFHFALIFNLTSGQTTLEQVNTGILEDHKAPQKLHVFCHTRY